MFFLHFNIVVGDDLKSLQLLPFKEQNVPAKCFVFRLCCDD